MSDLKHYIVTLKSFEDIESFRDDMETPGGNLFIPDRSIDVIRERPSTLSIDYWLTKDEADLVRQDSRVLAVEIKPETIGFKPTPLFTQTSSNWNKSSSVNNNHLNWGLLRCFEGKQRSNWGGTGSVTVTGTIDIVAEGRNVDVVIVDGHLNPSHPEFAVNSDGTGGTRVIQYNWFQHNSVVNPYDNRTTYSYLPYTGTDVNGNNNHGAHVGGTVAGNTQGWARKANIYNINPYGYSNPPPEFTDIDSIDLVEYIREFHKNKPINPATGRKNPTIVNNSWGYSRGIYASDIEWVNYRGVNYYPPFTDDQLRNFGIVTFGGISAAPIRYTALDTAIQLAINEGIIFLGAASNDYTKIDVPGGPDYENYWVESIQGFFYSIAYQQGTSPGAAPNVICVGAVSNAVNERKTDFSNCGPRVDIFAPGDQIMSALNAGTVTDARNSAYYLGKLSGTSMATPQVTGMLACVLETYPHYNQSQIKDYLLNTAKSGQMSSGTGGYDDYTDLNGAPNRYMAFKAERTSSGRTFPKTTYSYRPVTGKVFPRNRVRKAP